MNLILLMRNLYRHFCPVLILFHFFSFSTAQQHNYPELKVMSFNIRYPNPGDGMNTWDNRKEKVTSLIRFHEVDLLGIQEAHRSQLDVLANALPQFEWFGVCRTDGSTQPLPDNEFSAILYRKDRLERLEGNTFWLSETPDVPGSKSWDAALPRIVTWAQFRDLENGKVFFHFNTHFDHIGIEARKQSAVLLLEKVRSIAGTSPVIVTGDFNCSEGDVPYQILSGELNDAFGQSHEPHHGPKATFASNFEVSGLNDRRIDFIFVKNGFHVKRHGILSDSWNGVFASDHLPVLSGISLP